MTRLVLADTGPLYAAADPDDGQHRRAQAEIETLERGGLSVAVLYPTLLEAYTLVLHRLGLRAARTWLGEVADGATLINPDAGDYDAAAALIGRFADQPLTLFDGVLAVVALRLEGSVWSYDHHFDVMRAPVWRA